MWSCPLCCIKFTFESVESHLNKNHMDKDPNDADETAPNYFCSICGFLTRNFDDLALHCLSALHQLPKLINTASSSASKTNNNEGGKDQRAYQERLMSSLQRILDCSVLKINSDADDEPPLSSSSSSSSSSSASPKTTHHQPTLIEFISPSARNHKPSIFSVFRKSPAFSIPITSTAYHLDDQHPNDPPDSEEIRKSTLSQHDQASSSPNIVVQMTENHQQSSHLVDQMHQMISAPVNRGQTESNSGTASISKFTRPFIHQYKDNKRRQKWITKSGTGEQNLVGNDAVVDYKYQNNVIKRSIVDDQMANQSSPSPTLYCIKKPTISTVVNGDQATTNNRKKPIDFRLCYSNWAIERRRLLEKQNGYSNSPHNAPEEAEDSKKKSLIVLPENKPDGPSSILPNTPTSLESSPSVQNGNPSAISRGVIAPRRTVSRISCEWPRRQIIGSTDSTMPLKRLLTSSSKYDVDKDVRPKALKEDSTSGSDPKNEISRKVSSSMPTGPTERFSDSVTAELARSIASEISTDGPAPKQSEKTEKQSGSPEHTPVSPAENTFHRHTKDSHMDSKNTKANKILTIGTSKYSCRFCGKSEFSMRARDAHEIKAHTINPKETEHGGNDDQSSESEHGNHSETQMITNAVNQAGASKKKPSPAPCANADQVRVHMMARHGHYNNEEEMVALFKCRICQKPFTSKKDLTKHQRMIHQRQKRSSFKCNKCGYAFSFQSQYEKHVQTHSKVQIG